MREPLEDSNKMRFSFTDYLDELRTPALVLVLTLSIVGGSIAISGTVGAETSNLEIQGPPHHPPVTPGDEVSVYSKAADVGNDITYAIDSDRSGSIESDEVIKTVTTGPNFAGQGMSFHPTNYGMSSNADGSFKIYSYEESDSDGATDGPNGDGTSNQPETDYDQSVTLEVDSGPPTVSNVEVTAPKQVQITFSEGVEFHEGGGLDTTPFDYTDASSGGASSISSVTHDAGDATATLTLDTEIQNSDFGEDSVLIYSATILDQAGNEVPQDSHTYLDETGDDVEPTVSSFSATESGTDVQLSLTVDEELDSINIGIDSSTLTIADFSTSDTSAPYTYMTTYTPSSDGTYTAELNSITDTGSNTVTGFFVAPDQSATVDTTGPSFGTVSSPGGATNTVTPTIEIDSVSDSFNNLDTTKVSVEISVNGGPTVNTFTGTGTSGLSYDAGTNTITLALSQTSTTLSDATTYDVSVMASDDDENPNSNSKTYQSAFTVDTTPPTVSNVQISDATDGNGVVADGDSVTITADASDAVSSVDSVTAEASAFGVGSVTLRDDGTGADTQSGDGTYTGQVTVAEASASDGSQFVLVSATDDAGNGGSQARDSETLEVDITPPAFSSATTASIHEETTGAVIDVEAGDDGTNNPDTNVDYSLGSPVDDDTGFSIDSSTGQITLDSSKNFENPNDSNANNDYDLTVTATDNGGNSNQQSVTVSITDVNEAPTLTSSSLPSFSMNEDTPAPAKSGEDVAVSTLVSLTGSPENVNDPESDTPGIAIIDTDSSHGTWYYSDDGGSTWQAVGSVSDSNALLFSETSRLAFEPAPDYSGTFTKALAVRAWDQTSGNAGSYADTSSSGGMTAFSANTASTTVTVRNAPEVSSVTGAATNPSNANTVDFDVTFSESVSGVDADDFTLTTTDTATTANGDGDISVSSSDSSYTVTVANVQGDGDLGVDIIDDDSITSDATSVPLGGVGTSGGAGDGGFTSGETYTIDNTVPSVSTDSLVAETGGSDAVSDGSTVQITATVTDASAVSTVEADASAFDAGTVTLTDDGPNSATSDDQYSATFTVGANPSVGDQSVTVSATDAAGNGGSKAVASGTLTVDLTAPTVSAFDVSNPSGQDVRVSFESDEQLSTITASVNGPESATLDRSDFTESGSGPYTYTAIYGGSSDGDYTVTLDMAEDAAGNDGASGESETVAIETSPSPSPNPDPDPEPEPEPDPDDPTDTQNQTADGTQPTVWDNGTAVRQHVMVPANATVTRAEQVSLPRNSSGAVHAIFTQNASVSSIQFPAGTNGTVTVVEFDQRRPTYDDTPGRVVRQFQITGSPDMTNATATIRTRIATSELQTASVEQSDVRLAHRANSSWRILNTTVVEETNGTLVLEARAKGLSPFAVTAVGTPEAALSVKPTVGSTGDEFTLNAGNSTTPYGEIVSYEWSVGGVTYTGETATVTPEAAGEYTVELTVTTDAGRTATATTTLVVENETGSGTTPDDTRDNSTQTDPSTPPTNDTDSESETTTGDSGSGFGLIVALIALAGVALLAIRKSQ